MSLPSAIPLTGRQPSPDSGRPQCADHGLGISIDPLGPQQDVAAESHFLDQAWAVKQRHHCLKLGVRKRHLRWQAKAQDALQFFEGDEYLSLVA